MKNCTNMAVKVANYLAHRRSLGYALKTEEPQLLNFARYAERVGHEGPLTLALALAWVRLPAQADPIYWAQRLRMVRGLAKYLAVDDPQNEVPPVRILGPVCRRKSPHVYTSKEILQLMAKARRLSRGQWLRPLTVYTVIGLMASTGMRVSEVLRLQMEDVDLKNRVITVRASKFHRSRLLPLHSSVAFKLAEYDKRRRRCFPFAKSFFVGQQGAPLPYRTILHIFRNLVSDVSNRGDHPRPRFHDLRHAYACRILIRWSKRPATLDQRVLWLMHYLGHIRVEDTYWYLSAVPELLARAAVHFENSFTKSKS